MNPQYFSQQQYGAPPQNIQNDGQNNQGFENIPLVSSSNPTPLNVPPTSVSSSNQGSQLKNLLGKVPSGNLGPFTVLPQGHKMPGPEIQNPNNVDGNALKPDINSGANNNIINGSTSGFPIPPSQLPPSSVSLNQQNRSSPSLAQNSNFSAPQHYQVSHTASFPTMSPLNQSKPVTPQIGSSQLSQNNTGAPLHSTAASTSIGQQPPTSQFNATLNLSTLGNESNNPFVQSPPMNLTQSSLSEHSKIGVPQNQPFGNSHLPPSQNMPLTNSQSSTDVQEIQASSGPSNQSSYGLPPTGQSPLSSHQQLGQSQLPSRPPLSVQPQASAQQQLPGQQPPLSRQQPSLGQQSTQMQTQFPGQSPFPGQPPFSGQYTSPGKLSGQPPLPGQLPGQTPLPGQLSGQSPLQGQFPGTLSGQSPSTGPLPGQSSFPGKLPGQPSGPGQPPLGQQYPRQTSLSGPPTLYSPAAMQGHLSGPPMSQGHLSGQSTLSGQPTLTTQSPYGSLSSQTGGKPPMTTPQAFPPTTGQTTMQGQQNFNSPQSINQQNRRVNSPYGPSDHIPNQYQLSNQMQNMNISGPKHYSAVPQNGATNGDNGPHMPPPLNSQQMRSPSGYPPMPGQQSSMAQGGYPPQPGYPQQGYPQHGYPQPGFQQQNQQRRLDPDQMPSPIQVTTDDQNNRSGVFVTNQRGLMPPLVTTNFVVQDQGNCSPRFIRSSMYNVAITNDMMKHTAVPFSLVISPLARLAPGEFSPPIVNFGELGPVRCVRCKAYMCPYMTFVDSGRRFQCAFCKATTDVPAEYFQHLDHTGQRMDRFERPELVLGTYEFMATADYCKTNTLPKVPAILFIIDVSYNSIKSGLVKLLCSQMKEILRNLPVDDGQDASKMKVGFITYDNTVHFYNIKGTLAAPQMLVVGDTYEMFMPLLDGFLSTPEESEVIIDALMEQIPNMFAGTRQTETILLPAILAGVEALKASECSGKLMVFSSNLPTVDAPGKLKNRDDRKLLGTDKEKTILTPQNQAYNQLGQDCVLAGVSVDLFLFNNSYIDVATVGQVSRLSGGEVFKYTYFQADIDGERLIQDIIMDISRPIGFDAIMRVRTSTGVRPTEFYGHFYMTNTTDMELGSIDCDKAVAIEIKHDDKLHEDDGVYIQAALLYTSCSGQRRLRICNLSLKTCSQMTDLYRSCDLDTLINYWSKQALFKLMDNNPKAVKDAIVSKAAQVLATYRKNCASPSSAGQLILPECMKLLPLYVSCLLKSDALSGGSDMTVDERSFVMQACMTMDVPTSVYFFYPRLIPIHDMNTNCHDIPQPIRCSIEKMSEQGVYILENGLHMFLWIGLGANPDFIQKLFGVPSAIQVNIEQFKLPELDNPVSLAVRNIVEEIRKQRHRHMRLTLVRQREKLEHVFKHFLVEDKGLDGSPSYVDFLCHMHKEIRSLLS